MCELPEALRIPLALCLSSELFSKVSPLKIQTPEFSHKFGTGIFPLDDSIALELCVSS